MMATLQLMPDAAARIYAGQKFHLAWSRQQIIQDQIRRFAASPLCLLRYFGRVLNAIQLP